MMAIQIGGNSREYQTYGDYRQEITTRQSTAQHEELQGVFVEPVVSPINLGRTLQRPFSVNNSPTLAPASPAWFGESLACSVAAS